MRRPKPYFKKSHNAWYANFNHKSIRLAGDEKEAYVKYDLLMADRQPVADTSTVAALFDRFLDHHHAESSRATFDFYKHALDSFASYIGPRLRVCDVTPGHVGTWIKERHLKAKRARPDRKGGYVIMTTDKPTTNNYRRNLIRAVKAAFKWEEEQNPKCVSPIRSVKVPKSVPRDVTLTSDQFDRLISLASTSRDGGALLDLITVMRETGCRPQEVRRVEARHLDRSNPCWVFPAAESKGKEHKRVVLLTDKAFAICQRLALKHPEGPIFRTSKGNAWTCRLLSFRLYRLSKRLGFPVCPYAIRHLWATEAIMRGVDLLTIATIMGHRNLKMLSEVYSHISSRSDHLRAGLKRAVS